MEMLKERKRCLLWMVFFILATGLAVLCWVVIGFYQDYRSIPADHLIGNRPSVVAALKENGLPFSFLVIGDTTGSETAETLIETALKAGKSSFLVIVGDFVRRPDIWNHRFFLTEMTTEIKPSFPVFLVPGNHDIDYTSKIKSKERRVTPDVYESLYGSRDFDFTFNQCLFIISGIDPRNPLGYLSYLQQILSTKGENKKHVFVFMHIPPKGLAPYIESSHPDEEAFFSLLEKHKGITCFFGDYHGLWKGQKRGVNYIITGGGGRLKKWQSEWGKFNHIMRVTVEQDKVAEEVITIQRQIGLADRFEEVVSTLLFPIIQDFFGILYFIFGVFLVGSGYAVLKLVLVIRYHRISSVKR